MRSCACSVEPTTLKVKSNTSEKKYDTVRQDCCSPSMFQAAIRPCFTALSQCSARYLARTIGIIKIRHVTRCVDPWSVSFQLLIDKDAAVYLDPAIVEKPCFWVNPDSDCDKI